MMRTQLLWSADERYSNHRIPGMIVTKQGTLLVYCEARVTSEDWALMDIFLQRSEDQGMSFGEKIYLARGTEKHKTVNNPVMVEDRNGRIHFLYCEDYSIEEGRVLHRYSDDDGLSWSEAEDITSATRPQERGAFALGPGHGILTPAGALVIPIWMVPRRFEAKLHSHKPSVVSALYSTDDGLTWQLGDVLGCTDCIISPNETEAVVTSRGDVYFSIRHMSMQRVRAYTPNGYSQFWDYAPEYSLPDPCCFGSVAAFSDGKNPYTLLFANCATKESRSRVAIRASFDDGKTWSSEMVLDEQRGGYVELAVDSRQGLIYVLYENAKGESNHLDTMDYQALLKGIR